MRLLAFALLVTVGCFDPGQPSLRCTADKPLCPDGLVCINNECQQSNAADASADLTVADLSMPDQSLPAGCAAGNGRKLGANGCWLCPGMFTAGKAGELCSPTHSLPANASQFTETDCSGATGGFFFANVYGATKPGDPAVSECGKFTMVGYFNGFWGCGAGSIVVNANAACSGFRSHFQCSPASGVQCNNNSNLSNTKAENGVICCPK